MAGRSASPTPHINFECNTSQSISFLKCHNSGLRESRRLLVVGVTPFSSWGDNTDTYPTSCRKIRRDCRSERSRNAHQKKLKSVTLVKPITSRCCQLLQVLLVLLVLLESTRVAAATEGSRLTPGRVEGESMH